LVQVTLGGLLLLLPQEAVERAKRGAAAKSRGRRLARIIDGYLGG
jgi:hypothetical protein